MLTPQQILAYARLAGYPKQGWILYESNGEVYHAKRTEKPYEATRELVEFKAPVWLPQSIVEQYIKDQVNG
jgi:hypothetical protein